MKAFKLELLAAALSMALAATAGAQTSSSTSSGTGGMNATPGGSSMRGGIPAECANMTGRQLSDCVRDHNPSSTNSLSGTNGAANAPAKTVRRFIARRTRRTRP